MHDKEVENCVSCVLSCGCLSTLVLLWLIAGIWPDPSYIAIKASEKKIDAIQSHLQTLQTLIEHAQWVSDHTPEPKAIKPLS
jgi:hypothetical protein